MSLQPITMTKPRQPINERLAQNNNEYAIQPLVWCHLCRKPLYKRRGALEHQLAHAEGRLPYGLITRYWVTGAYLAKFCSESKAALMKVLERSTE